MSKRAVLGVSILVSILLIQVSSAIDRNAKAIVSVGGDYLKQEDFNGWDAGIGAEIAVNKPGTLALEIGTSYGEWEDDETFKGIRLGVGWYVTPRLKLGASAGYELAEWGVDDYVTEQTTGVPITYHWDWETEADVFSFSLGALYRFVPATENISPFISVQVGWSQIDAEAKEGTITKTLPSDYHWVATGTPSLTEPAEGNVSYDYDNSLSASLSPGLDIALTRDLVLGVVGSIGLVDSGGSMTVAGIQYPFSEGSETFWSLGAALKFFI